MPNDDRVWTLKPRKKKSSKPRQFKIKLNGVEKIVTERELPETSEDLELEEVTEEMIRMSEFDKIHRFTQQRGWKPLSAVFRYLEKYPNPTAEELQYIENRLGFKPGWWKYKYREIQEKAIKAQQQ